MRLSSADSICKFQARPHHFVNTSNSSLRSDEFYEKALDGTLTEGDFDFIKRGQSEEQVKGSVRRKINVLPDIINIFSSGTKVEEDFTKNRVSCSFAAGK